MVGVSAPDPVERYLDQLLAELHGTPGNPRRVLAEVEHHLRDAIDEGVAEGLPLDEARRRALDRFGSPRMVARQFASPARRLVPPAVLGQLVLAMVLLGGIGLAAIGVSGVVEGMGMAFGKTFVAGDPPGLTYTPARCADFQEYYPTAPSCADAAVDHHFDETVQYRVAAGVLGLLVLGGYWLARRRRPVRPLGLLPDGFVATTGAGLFGLVGGFLVLSSLNQLVLGVDGAGQYLSGGIVSLPVALAFLISLNRTLARRAAVAEA
jgi:HAAS